MITTKATSQNPVLECVICKDKTDLRECLSQRQIEEGFDGLKRGLYVQRAFPSLPADIRELFISSICGSCYNEAFNEE